MKKCMRQLQVRVRFKFKKQVPDWIKLEITRVACENKKHTIGGKGKEIVVQNLQYNSKKIQTPLRPSDKRMLSLQQQCARIRI